MFMTDGTDGRINVFCLQETTQDIKTFMHRFSHFSPLFQIFNLAFHLLIHFSSDNTVWGIPIAETQHRIMVNYLIVKFKDGMCTELCLKLWFESDWHFCIITESGWFLKLTVQKQISN